MTEVSENVRQHVYKLCFEDLGLCCGLPEESYSFLKELLTAIRSKTDIDQLLPHDGVRYLILGALDSADLIEHGSIIDAAWLTRKGEWYWQAITRCDYDDVEGVGLPHDGKACMDTCYKPFWGLS